MSEPKKAKPPPKPPAKSQRQRFIDAAREAQADESGETFERAFDRIVKPMRKRQSNST